MFARNINERKREDSNLFHYILWIESTFSTSVIFNCRKYNFWSHENALIIKEIAFQRQNSINVWCGILLRKMFLDPMVFRAVLFREALRCLEILFLFFILYNVDMPAWSLKFPEPMNGSDDMEIYIGSQIALI